MSVHVFCDESKASGFRLAAVPVDSADLSDLRSVINGLRLRGQRRVHFSSERDRRRKQIVRALADAGVHAVIYEGLGHRTEKDARDAVVGQLTDDVTAMGAGRLVLERDESTVASDKQIIMRRLAKAGNRELRYDHCRAHEECLLSVPDALIWCWAKGGSWRASIVPLIDDVVGV